MPIPTDIAAAAITPDGSHPRVALALVESARVADAMCTEEHRVPRLAPPDGARQQRLTTPATHSHPDCADNVVAQLVNDYLRCSTTMSGIFKCW